MKKNIIAMLLVISVLSMILPIFYGSLGSSQNELNDELYLEESFDEIIPAERIEESEISNLSYQMSSENDFCWPWETCYESQYVADGWETNNTLGTAKFVGDALAVNRTSLWYGTLHDVSETENDVDYYKIRLNADRRIQVQLTNIPSGTNYNLALYKISWGGFLNLTKIYTLIGSSSNTSNLSEYIYTSGVQSKGDYIIKVSTSSGLSSSEYKIYFSARIDVETIAYNAGYSSEYGRYRYNIVKFTADMDRTYLSSDFLNSIVITSSEAIFLPYAVLQNINTFIDTGERLSDTNEFLGFSTEQELYEKLAFDAGFALGVTIAFYGATTPLSVFFSLTPLILLIQDYFEMIELNNDFTEIFDSALSQNKGMYMLFEEGYRNSDLQYYEKTSFGLLNNQYSAYNIFRSNVTVQYYDDCVGDIGIMHTW